MDAIAPLSLTWILGHILALGIGISLGLLGGGGSILAVPIFMYVMGFSPQTAIAASLVVVGCVSLLGAIPHWKQGNVNVNLALAFAPAAMLGAYGGARLTALPGITETVQLVAFGVMMLAASVLMIRKSRPSPFSGNGVSGKAPRRSWLIPVQGLVVGVMTGFVGVGGGFAIVPAFVLLAKVPMKQAIGTSLPIIAFNSVTAVLGYLDRVSLDWGLVVSFAVAASLGTTAGAYLTRRIDASHLQKGFGYFVLAIAVFVLIKR